MRIIYLLIIIVMSVFGSQHGHSGDGKRCHDEYVVVVAERPTRKSQPRPIATATLVSSRIGIGDVTAGANAVKSILDVFNTIVGMEKPKEKPQKPIIVYPSHPPPAAPIHSFRNETKINKSEHIVDNTNIDLTFENTIITNYFINETYNNITNVRIDTNETIKNITIGNINFIDYDVNEIASLAHEMSVMQSKSRTANRKRRNIFVFRLEKSIFSIMPNIKLVKLPVPRHRILHHAVGGWLRLGWSRSQNKQGRTPDCGSFTIYGFGKSSQENAMFADREGAPLELKCFVDHKGDGSEFSDCVAPQNGPIMCGDVQVGLLIDGHDCQQRYGRYAKSVEYVPIESIFDFIVDFMEAEEGVNKTAATEPSAISGVGIQLYANVVLILAIIVL